MAFDFASLLMHVTAKTFSPGGDGPATQDCRNARGDGTTNVLNTIDYSHHEIHNGGHYNFTDSNTINAGTSDAVDYLLVVQNTTEWSHFTFDVDGSAITSFSFYEDTPKASSDGFTQETVYNNNRNSGNTAGLQIWSKIGSSDSSSDIAGTLLYEYSNGSSSVQSKSPAGARGELEFILRQNTRYLFRVLSGSASNLCNVIFKWYEHTNR